KLIAVGSGLKKELEEFSGRKDIEVINNLVPIELFEERNIKSSNDFIFFSLAFLEGEKGMDTLIKAFAQGFKGSNCILKIGGDGSQRPWLEAMAEELGVSKQVIFLGGLLRNEVSKYMNECDVFVLASRYETFGVVYIEALACGKPIIGTYNGGAEDIINDFNGKLANVDNVDSLKNSMISIKENVNLYNSHIIKSDCIRRFGKETFVSKIISVYEEINI
ncbi:MAG: glycosyltransferase, partial [Clostridium sp.]